METRQLGSILSPRPLQIVKPEPDRSTYDENSPKNGNKSGNENDCHLSELVEATPRPRNPPASVKSSSYKLIRAQTPKLLSKLRSFSNGGRVSSSRATCRHYSIGSRRSSTSSSLSPTPGQQPGDHDAISEFGGSSSDGSYDPDPIMPLGFDNYNTYGYRHTGNLLPPVEEPADPMLTPSLLIPQICITPEVTALADGHITV